MSGLSHLLKGGAQADAPEPTEPTTIANSQIRADGGTQMREAMNLFTVSDYAEAWRAGAQFPPIVVFFDGTDYWPGDGFHRLQSHINVYGSGAQIAADIRPGTRRDAILYAASANAAHGLRRTNQDKLRAVRTLLRDSEWSQYSDNQIAALCAVSQPFVSTHRKQLEAAGEIAASLVRKTASGATMDTARIGNTARATTPVSNGGSTYNGYKVEPTPPNYVSPVAPDLAAADVDEEFDFEETAILDTSVTYNGYKSEETRPLLPDKMLFEFSPDVAGELLTVIRQNGLNFLMRKSSVKALELALSEVIE